LNVLRVGHVSRSKAERSGKREEIGKDRGQRKATTRGVFNGWVGGNKEKKKRGLNMGSGTLAKREKAIKTVF